MYAHTYIYIYIYILFTACGPLKQDVNKQVYITHMSSQKTRHQKLNSNRVTNSLGDKVVGLVGCSHAHLHQQNKVRT